MQLSPLMSTDNKAIHHLYEGLVALSDNLFPKKCSNCGRVYKTAEEYIKETDPVYRGSGLQSSEHLGLKAGDPVVQLYRNCVCGSTMLTLFGDRRDKSEQGQKYRVMFDDLLQKIVSKGIDPKNARAELLKVMRGEQSKKLAKFGIEPPART
jgi:hypothetical protein